MCHRRNQVTLSPESPGIFRFRLAPAETPALAGGGSNPRVMARRGLVKWRMQSQTTPRPHGVPESFYSKFGKLITAVLSGFDRIRFRAAIFTAVEPSLSYSLRGDPKDQTDFSRRVVSGKRLVHECHLRNFLREIIESHSFRFSSVGFRLFGP